MHPKTNFFRYQILIFVCLITFSLFSDTTVYGQKEEKTLQKADELYGQAKFSKAAKQYEKVIAENEYNQQAYLQLSRCLSEIEEYADAESYFSVVFVESDTVDPAFFLEFGELLMKNDKPSEARSYFTSYNNLIENHDPRALQYINSIEDITSYYIDSAFIHIQKLNRSSEAQDDNPAYYREKLFFLSNRESYASDPLQSSIFTIPPYEIDDKAKTEKIKGSAIDNEIIEGFCIAEATGEIFFVHSPNDETQSPGLLMRAFLENEGTQISKPEPVQVENFNGSILNPSVNSSGSILIFASNAGNTGGYDLYSCERTAYGYSSPSKLPGFINTLGDENYPHLIDDSLLFFSSDGHGGLGGLDVFYSNLNETTSIPSNLGYPVNSRYDDYGFSLASDADIGFLASDRAVSKSLSDLYSFSLNQIRAMGMVTDKESGENLKNVAIEISKKGEATNEMTLADNGKFSLIAEPGDEYDLTIYREGYSMESFSVAVDDAKVAGLYEVDMGSFPIYKLDSPVTIPEPEPEPEPIYIAPVITDNLPVFRLQVAAAKRELSDSEIKRKYAGSNPVSMFREEGWYKYIIGEYSSYFEANEARKACGVADAFIAAYEHDTKLVLSDAIKIAHRIPENVSQLHTLRSEENTLDNYTIFFPFNKHFPIKAESEKLAAIKIDLKDDPSLMIEIVGHTDAQGSKDYNLSLAEARAEYIRDELIMTGIRSERIIIESLGESQMRQKCTENCTEEEYRVNRRAEVYLYRN